MTDATASIASSLLGAIVGGAMAVWGAIKAVQKSSQDLEATEIRRQKVECIVALSGLRFVLRPGVVQLNEYRTRLSFELNKISTLWAADMEVVKGVREFLVQRTNENFVRLIRNMGRTTKLPLENLLDTDIEKFFSMEQLDR